MSNIISVSEGKIALYAIGDSSVYVDVVFKDETFWMTQKGLTQLFEVDLSVISRHLKNIYAEEELSPEATVAKIAIVQNEGGREVNRSPEFYSLDAIIAVGYRVNSNFLNNNRRRVLEGKGHVTHEDALKKAVEVYEQFRIQQDRDYISNFDDTMTEYLRGKDNEPD